jgi:hypothetical protein
MNTLFSCGTMLENGQFRPPCVFTATKVPGGIPVAAITPGSLPPDPTVANAEQSIATTMKAMIVIGGLAFGINSLLALGKNPKK